MQPAFEDKKLWEDFKKELLSWKGTPYRHLQRTKGRGADCTLYLAEVLLKLGILNKNVEVEFYPKNWFLNTKEDIIMDSFRKNFMYNTNKKYVWVKYDLTEEVMEGDILLFCIRPSIAAIHHTSVYLGDRKMFHGINGKTFDTVDFSDKWKKFCKSFFRICEAG